MSNYELWERHQAEQDRAEARFPTCSECGHKIYEVMCYEINDEPICDDCMENNHRRFTECFM